MLNWIEVLKEIKEEAESSPLDRVRYKYLQKIHALTGRNVIAYYSGWLHKPGAPGTQVNDKDKQALMLTIHK